MTADYFLNVVYENYRKDSEKEDIIEIANNLIFNLCFSEGERYISKFSSEVRGAVSHELYKRFIENSSKIKIPGNLEHACCCECSC
ncbi:MAG: hypothetical protein AABW56_00840 [Nanoarchaeota archaeon]